MVDTTNAPPPCVIPISLSVSNELLHHVFVTAMEGGIDYWAGIEEYRSTVITPVYSESWNPDLLHFRAIIRDLDSDVTWVIDRAQIIAGINAILNSEITFGTKAVPREWWAKMALIRAIIEDDVDYIDSILADIIVQISVFDGDIVYG